MYKSQIKVQILTILAFSSVCSALVLDCKYSMQTYQDGKLYSCVIESDYKGDSLIVEDVSQDHHKAKTNHHVKWLSIDSKKWPSLPRNLEEFFPNLECLQMLNTGLKKISWEDFQGLPKMKYLFLRKNKLQSIDEDLFKYLPELKIINLSANPLRHMGRDISSDLLHLEYLDLSETTCINQKARSRLEVEELTNLLDIRCPPSHEMTLKMIVESLKQLENIGKEVLKEVSGLTSSINRIEKSVGSLEGQSKSLEKPNKKRRRNV